MSIQADVEKALLDAGEQLKKDLWRPEDKQFIANRAKDLVGLNAKAAAATDAATKRQYQLAAAAVVDHVKLQALLRLQVTQDHLLDALGRFFLNVALPALGKILKALFIP